jgi:hypothetical protein
VKILIESTDERVFVDGKSYRIWRGVTAKGTPCMVFISRLGTGEEHVDAFREEIAELNATYAGAMDTTGKRIPSESN